MIIRSIVGGLVAGVMMLSGAAAWADTAEQAVIAAEHQTDKAAQANSAELMAPLLADNFVSTDQDGNVLVGKAANLADMKNATVTSYETSDLKVMVYGDAAVATGTYVFKGTYMGQPIDHRGRYTDTWVKMNGKWLQVASHASLIKK